MRQSIGEKQTQTSLNTFHKAGQSEKTMTSGIPRFQELINATKNPRIVNHKIYFPVRYDNIQDVRMEMNNKITNMSLSDFVYETKHHINKEEEKWYDAFDELYDKSFKYSHAVSFKIKVNKLYEYNMTLEQICKKISDKV